MIEHLPPEEQEWLACFFASPNELSWSSLLDASAPPLVADQVRQWLALIDGSRQGAPLILPFVRGGAITGWYATTQGLSGGYELREEINAWLGPTWLSRIIEPVPVDTRDPMAAVLFGRFGGTVYRFTGPDDVAMKAISARLSEFAGVVARRPQEKRTHVRPVGAIRSDFERALLAGDVSQAEAMIVEFKQTGRLNEENLRYLEVRLSAGLGLWPEIARDHWRIKTLADLALPPQVLSDLIEALYRTYIDPVEATGDAESVRDAFARNIVEPYPKLFGSRRGIRAPRVTKAFVLYEQLQRTPDAAIVDQLLSFLPADTNASLFQALPSPQLTPPPTTTLSEADEAFDDFQFDRAFEFYLRLPPSRKTLSRMVSCVGTIGTDDARDSLLAVVDKVGPEIFGSLAPAVRTKIESLAQERATQASSSKAPKHENVNPWIRWAEQLQVGDNLSAAERDVQSAPTNWDAAEVREDAQLAKKFADILSGLDGKAGEIARAAVPQIIAGFFPDEIRPPVTAKPVASLLVVFIALDEALSRTDLDLLAQLTVILIEQGLSSDEYVSLIGDLEDVQKRIGSYACLSWSLDLNETLAVLPSPSNAARDARLRLFMQVLGQVTGFSHRLTDVDLPPLEMLAKDYGVADDNVAGLKRVAVSDDPNARSKPDLKGKTIGIYTLAESAGTRAKIALEDLFPGCQVVVNSDLVATAQLTSLAKTADIFVFAWKSSSHQAFYCVKDARVGNSFIWAPGKGTASILRAIFEHLK